ncbi:pyridoxamine 5'-phosphate oxidase family protein [Mycobacterium sp. B14F4]|uniref:pyridoxamine 5'-phosphate oxidase family protein n=1 Tax=Mycobacterium sp. B14F4 TaxID=3153565 RepID=UPI00325E9A7C
MVDRGELRGGVTAVLARASFAAVTARDRDGRLWISPVTGPPGFLAATTPTRLSLKTALSAEDPLRGLDAGQPIGIVVMEFAAKRRVRINGTLAAADGATLDVDVVQAYGNCPQYIRPRRFRHENSDIAGTSDSRRGSGIAAEDIALIRGADTFFLGTTHPERGNDASHRGGPVGFVDAEDTTVKWPDYPGNNMFNSFGNLAVDPSAALLFVDFRGGRVLQLSGNARVEWTTAADGADTARRVRFAVEQVVSRQFAGLREAP